jgi:dipeptidyl aminopeptidase/acylaminoacyl peptidase
LDSENSDEERALRQSTSFAVEIKVPSLDIFKIAAGNAQWLGWDRYTGALKLLRRDATRLETDQLTEYYERRSGGWQLAKSIVHGNDAAEQPTITVEQGLNTPPRVTVTSLGTQKKELLLDPNPQFNELSFGTVNQIQWIGADGHPVLGALYLPPNYILGRKYPLVIQTHGFEPQEFWIDGPFTTAFAAQVLAGLDMAVLQIPDSHDFRNTPQEAPKMTETYEKAVDFLDSLGLIDRNRMGIVGFSRTGLYVRYLLTHSHCEFSAAVIADGFDDGYFNYLAVANSSPYFASEVEALMGKSPFGDGLSLWEKRSSGFSLDKVAVPVQLQANGPASLVSTWDWFSGLTRLEKPVDMLYLPKGSHILEKPKERLASQQSMVDWFAFWLKGEEDPTSLKQKQYSRWRVLRDLAKNQKSQQGARVKGSLCAQ